MQKTLRLTTVQAIAINYENGEVKQSPLKPLVYEGRKWREKQIEDFFKEQLEDKTQKIMVVGENETTTTYEVELSKFLEIATEKKEK